MGPSSSWQAQKFHSPSSLLDCAQHKLSPTTFPLLLLLLLLRRRLFVLVGSGSRSRSGGVFTIDLSIEFGM
jgi:hypothetical protein